jgi:glycosyltransferase involved in cell wall biosynthesis
MENKLSACLIVKNEESCIEKCLKSIESFVDEIIVVDTGSTDGTVKIAGEYTDRIFKYKWTDDFSAARNFSAECAKNDWIIVLDADETVDFWNVQEIGSFIKSENQRRVGRVKIISTTDESRVGALEERAVTDSISRLFNKRYFHFTGTIHEQLTAKDGGASDRTDVEIALLHSGYKDAEIKRKNKTARNISMLKKALKKQGDDCYLLFQLGKSYSLEKNNVEALRYFEKAVTLIENYNLEYAADLITAYGYAVVNTNDFKAAMIIEKCKDYYSNSPDYNFLLAYIYMMNAMFSKAAETFLKCTELEGGKMDGVTSWLPLYNIGVIFECLGKHEEALEYYKRCGNYEKAQGRIAAILGK